MCDTGDLLLDSLLDYSRGIRVSASIEGGIIFLFIIFEFLKTINFSSGMHIGDGNNVLNILNDKQLELG